MKLSKKRYEMKRTADGLNVMVETESSYRRTEKERFIITTLVAVVSAVAAIISAVFSILVYFNS